MNIARLLNRDNSDMDIARLLNHDDSGRSDHEASVSIVNSHAISSQSAETPATTSQPVVTPSNPTQRDGTPAAPLQRAMTPTPPPERALIPSPPSRRAATRATPLQRSMAPPPPSVMPAPTPQVEETAAPPQRRAVARARPPRPRKPSIASLRAQVVAFQFVVDNLPFVMRGLDDDDSSTSTVNSTESDDDDATTIGDPDAQRMRTFLRRTVMLTKQAQEEIAKRTEYLRLLKRHYEGTANLRKLMRGLRLDDWFWRCDRWREMTRLYYQPFSEDRCYEIVQETLEAIKKHKIPEGTRESGAFGWRDWVHLDADGHYVRFMTRKPIPNVDMEQIVDHTWSLYCDGDLLKKTHLGDNCELFHQILQQISPDMMIVQRVEKYPDLVQLTHSLALTFRVQTATGYMIVTRCIESPQLQSLMKAEGLSMSGSFIWDSFDVIHEGEQGEPGTICLTVAGSTGSDNPTYARRARDEILVALLRYEIQLMDSPLVSIESSEKDTAVTSDSQASHA